MPYREKSIVMKEYLGHNHSEDWSTESGGVEKFVKSQVYEVYSFSHKFHMHYILAGYIEMKSRSIVIYLVKYSGNNFKPSLCCCEKSSSGNISFLFKYSYLRPFTSSDWPSPSPITYNRLIWNISLQSAWRPTGTTKWDSLVNFTINHVHLLITRISPTFR